MSNLSLPRGWELKETILPNGLSTGAPRIHYISPVGEKVTTLKRLQAILGPKYDVSCFNWRTGKFSIPQPSVQKPKKVHDGSSSDVSRPRFSPYTRNMSRPLTMKPKIITAHPMCKRTVNTMVVADQPRQLFWEKRFLESSPILLPKKFVHSGGPAYTDTQLLFSLVYAVTSKNISISGQDQQKPSIDKNPLVAPNFNQPMVKHYVITDEDITKQEARVQKIRQRLVDAKNLLQNKLKSGENEC